jgi:hypothetical protein
MKDVLVNIVLVSAMIVLVYMGIEIADTNNEKWLCALMAMCAAFGLPYHTAGDDD